MKSVEKTTTPTVFITGNPLVDKRVPCDFRKPNISSVIQFLKDQKYPAEVETEMIKIVSAYPHHALEGFFKNIDKILVRVNKKLSDKTN